MEWNGEELIHKITSTPNLFGCDATTLLEMCVEHGYHRGTLSLADTLLKQLEACGESASARDCKKKLLFLKVKTCLYLDDHKLVHDTLEGVSSEEVWRFALFKYAQISSLFRAFSSVSLLPLLLLSTNCIQPLPTTETEWTGAMSLCH